MNTKRIQEISLELWEITIEQNAKMKTPTQGENSEIISNCVNMIKYATWIIDDAVEIYENIAKKETIEP